MAAFGAATAPSGTFCSPTSTLPGSLSFCPMRIVSSFMLLRRLIELIVMLYFLEILAR